MRHRSIARYHHQVYHIHRVSVTHSHSNRAINILPPGVKSLALLPYYSLQFKVILELVVKANKIFNARCPGQLVLQNVPQELARDSSDATDWPVVGLRHLTQQHVERYLAFNTVIGMAK